MNKLLSWQFVLVLQTSIIQCNKRQQTTINSKISYLAAHIPATHMLFLKQTTQSPSSHNCNIGHTPITCFLQTCKKKSVYSNKHYSRQRHNSRQKPEMRAYYTDVSAYDRFFFQAMQKKEAQFGLQNLLARQYSAQPFLCWHN